MIKIALNNGIKQSLFYGASIALMKGISLLMLPFITSHLTTEEFGRLEVISTLAIIGSILVGMGLEDTLFRFAGIEKNVFKRRIICAEIFTLTSLIALLTFTCGWFIAPLITPFFPGQTSVYEIRLVLTLLTLEGAIAIPLGWLRLNNKASLFFLASTGRALLQTLLIIIFLSLDRKVTGILEAGLLASVIQMLLLTTWQVRNTGLGFNLITCKLTFIYSLPIVASGLIAFSLNGMDRWILAEHSTLAQVAEFSIAAKFALAMVLFMQPFGMWWSPRRFNVLNHVNGEKNIIKFITMGYVIALLSTVVVALISPALIHYLLPQNYQQATHYVVAIVIIMLLKELVELFNIGCFIGHTTSSQLIINVLSAIIGLSAMLYLTPQYQVWGIIFSLLLAQSIRLLLFYRVSQYFLPLNYPVRALLTLSILSAFWLLLGAQTIHFGHAIMLIICATASLIFFAKHLKLIEFPIQFRHKAIE